MTQEQFITCIDRIRKGDKNGLKDIYDEYLGDIYMAIYGIVNQKENAEDVTQDFFVKLYSNANKIEFKESHKAYLIRMAKNMAIDYLRHHSRMTYIDEFVGEEYEVVAEDKVEDEVVANITIKEALANLNENERQVVSMKVLSEMTFQEIADAFGEPLGTITWRYQNAIKKLRRCGYE